MICACLPKLAVATESPKEFDKRMEWYNDARFGMFLHWGVYSTLEGKWQGKNVHGYAEWIHAKGKIPADQYQKQAIKFQPTNFDADKWIRTAKDAGMKYFVITTKHHEGYCLWDSAYTKYDIKDASGWKIDPLAELSKACKKYGIRFGTYYSLTDWHHASQNRKGDVKGHATKMKSPQAKKEYVQYMKNQIRELIEKYDTDILWFDGDWVSWWTLEDGADLYAYIRSLKPSIIINNRVSKRSQFKKDFGTPENFTPGAKLDYYWEACWTINHSWGFKKSDTNWTSTQSLVQKMVDIASKGGNLLLNIGPKSDGSFPEACTTRLLEMGQWLDKNGEAYYGTDFSEVPKPSWGRVTQKGKKLYLHVFDWPKNGLLKLDKIKLKKAKAYLLVDKTTALPIKVNQTSIEIKLPQKAPNNISAVICLKFKGKLKTLTQKDSLGLKGSDLYLEAKNVDVSGKGPLKVESNKNLGYWSSTDNKATWEFENGAPTTYEIELHYAVPSSYSGAKFLLECNGKKFTGKVKATNNWNDYQIHNVGRVTINSVERHKITLTKKGQKGKALFNLKGVILRPITK